MNQRRFQNKICLVTASSTGIGFETSKRLALEGATVIINSRNQKNVDNAVKQLQDLGLNATGFVCHQGNKEQRKKMLNYVKDKYGRLDVLVLNAAVNPDQNLGIINTEDTVVDKIFEINVKCTFMLLQEALPLMPEKSNIIFISTHAIYIFQDGNGGMYQTSKLVLNKLSKILALSLKNKRNIRVNTISPGLIQTDFGKSIWGNEVIMKYWNKSLEAPYRLGQPQDIANIIAFIASDEAKYISGEIINLSGTGISRL